MFKTRFISMLVLLAAVATGAMAQTETLLTTKLQYGECGNRFIQLYCIWILSIPR